MTIKIGSEVTIVSLKALRDAYISDERIDSDKLVGDVFVVKSIRPGDPDDAADGWITHKNWRIPLRALKPVVRYNEAVYVAEGGQALVDVVSHYSPHVAKYDGNKVVRTSTILNCDAVTGRFETRNSVYMRAEAGVTQNVA